VRFSNTHFALLTAVFGLLMSSVVSAKTEFPDVTEEGLIKLKDTDLSLVYAKQGVDLSIYDKVWLVDATVAFKKNWKRDQNRSYANKVTARDVERIKTGMAELFREVFTETLTNSGHELVGEAGEDVLIVRPAIVNLDVAAPDVRSASRNYQMVESAGEMTLYVELYDSVTGDILVKAMDRKSDRSNMTFQWQTRAGNIADAKRILRPWAERLASALSDAQDTATSEQADD
jgi:hypothetical protein